VFRVLPRIGGGGKSANHDGPARKATGSGKSEQKKGHDIHLLLGPTDLTPRKEMVEEVSGRNLKRKGEGRGISKGEKGSGARGTGSEGPKGQGG